MTTKVLGFYVKIGSIDYPSNSDPNSPFGWDIDNTSKTPVFKYSLNDVENAFISVREFRQAANYIASSTNFLGDPSGATNSLLVECGKTDEFDYRDLVNEDPADSFWQDVFRCIEYIGRNQATVQGSSWASSFSNYGDAALGSVTGADGNANPYYVQNYVRGSITYSVRPNSTRLQWVQFAVTNNTYGNIIIQIYLDADAWCERTSSTSYKVYTYEDLDGDSTISDSEMDSQVVAKIFDITKEGKYKTYNTIVIDKRISDTVTTTEQFFIFSTLKSTITVDKMKEEVKEYLTEKYNANDTYLRYTYPTLFDENEIRIIPVWDNQITQATGESKDVHPLSIKKLSDVLTAFGYSISASSSDYRPSEVFYLGPGAGWSNTVAIKFVLPIIAIEQDSTSGISYPISSRFPDYKPIYGQNESSKSSEFHFILLTIINYLDDGDTVLNNEFVSEYSVSEAKSGTRKTVTFTYANDLWTVYGPIGSAD